ncbi:hypothetical protein FF1_014162 [Malus domestica]
MSLSEFYNASGTPASNRVSLTPNEMMQLLTGPNERSAEEMQYGRLGGGFPSYDCSGTNPGRGEDGSWGGGGRRSYGGFDDNRRGPPSRVSDLDQPSRVDEADNWAMTKKFIPSVDSGRADEVDNWVVRKKPACSSPT